MASKNPNKGPTELRKEWIELVDKSYHSPQERAQEVFTILQLAGAELDLESSTYDLLCFAIEFIGTQAIGPHSNDRDFVSLSVTLSRWLYNAHYFHTKEILGEPDRDIDIHEE
jgi:hypothetical protein